MLAALGLSYIAIIGFSTFSEKLFGPAQVVFNEYWVSKGFSEPPLAFDQLIMQSPSALVVLGMISLFFLLLLEPPLLKTAGIFLPPRFLLKFQAPTPVIWFFLVGLLGRFVGFGEVWLDRLTINIFNICLVIYSFQGLAVFASLLRYFRLSKTLRFLITAIAILQAFVLLVVLGIADYWIDFRNRFGQRSTNLKSSLFKKK